MLYLMGNEDALWGQYFYRCLPKQFQQEQSEYCERLPTMAKRLTKGRGCIFCYEVQTMETRLLMVRLH